MIAGSTSNGLATIENACAAVSGAQRNLAICSTEPGFELTGGDPGFIALGTRGHPATRSCHCIPNVFGPAPSAGHR